VKRGRITKRMSATPIVRCAIYTRTSSDERLHQDFNSLNAQTDACRAYISSQRSNGWTLVSEVYEDGGFSGKNTERPALNRLLDDIRAGKIDAVIRLIRDALKRLWIDAEYIIELRALDLPMRNGGVITAAGWFDDATLFVRAAAQLDQRGAQVYFTLNPVQPALLCRGYNRIVERPKTTTSDRDVLRRAWIPIDVDPVRPAGVSSNDAELGAARVRALEVAGWLTDKLGEPISVWACSGNGFHLLFRADLPNDERSTTTIKSLLEETSDKFADSAVKIDTTVFNAARIWRLYGTMNRKGDSVPKLNRVHRRAAILGEKFLP